ncbi:NUDIX hydrolase [Oleiagrimonas soli]|uniref:Phosphatase NudJ n=1 Tax=Oleiagrimonas soli TaxID=1543381 RepID=A0A099CZ82_9GAMM|nr:NUDIX hydrolase [Oleiagrimonas soli]KGI78345.1 7,8-dihydro-8-oxoguanine-triphosphatase [Oleiagrimonas soli]MBB6183154.1 8-oxo-dGTP pyrophosphatase MutT (NUDIX family) [Oleiagrimonas soli]
MNDANAPAPAIWCPHVTVASIVADDDGRFLMVEESVGGAVRYNQPAGHLEPDEALTDAAVRETLEETGWDIELHHFVGVHQWYSPQHGEHIVRFSFAGRALRHRPEHPLDSGIIGPQWLRRDEIEALGERLRSPLVLRSIDAWLGGQRLPLSAVTSLLGKETAHA